VGTSDNEMAIAAYMRSPRKRSKRLYPLAGSDHSKSREFKPGAT